jgi:hypothetical protein
MPMKQHGKADAAGVRRIAPNLTPAAQKSRIQDNAGFSCVGVE